MFFEQVNVMWVGKLLYEPGFSVAVHEHNFFQFFYVMDGTGYIYTNNLRYRAEAGKVFLCPPGFVHKSGTMKNESMRTIEVKLEIKDRYLYNELVNISGCIDVDPAEIRGNIESMVVKVMHRDTLSRDIINMEMSLTLLKILRQLKNKETEDAVYYDSGIMNFTGTGGIFAKMLDYINRNLHTPISLEDLAKLVGHDPAYLCRIFKREFGITPMKYINELKIIRAKELLMNSNMSITEISEHLGFNSVNYFSKCFKRKKNITAQGYKKSMKNTMSVVVDEQYSEEL